MPNAKPTQPAGHQPPKKRRKLAMWKKLLLLAGASLFTLLLCELGIRVFATFFFPKLMVTDAQLGWSHAESRSKPYTNEDGAVHPIVLNEFGHRGPSYGLARNPGKRRLLVLGDSFTEAVHVAEEEMFSRRLELARDDLEVLNAGVGGWGTVQQLLYLRDHGLKFEPDAVLLVAYENDLSDNCISYSPGIAARPWAKWHGTLAKGSLEVIEDYDDAEFLKFVLPVPLAGFLMRNSYLFYAVNERLWFNLNKDALRKQQDADLAALEEEQTQKVFLALLQKVHSLCAANDIDLHVAMIPSLETVRAGKAPWHDQVGAACRADGIGFVSLLQPMVDGIASGRRLYFDEDIHWTHEGHAVAAQAMAPLLRK
ncbi:MAG: SGNH/GDSL hydrolase family protein [Planctomycetota bacterium]